MYCLALALGFLGLLRCSSGQGTTKLSFESSWVDSASEEWSPNDRYGAFDFHGLFNTERDNPTTLSKDFLLPASNETFAQQNEIYFSFTIYLGCSVDPFEVVAINISLNGINYIEVAYNRSSFNYKRDNPWKSVCTWHTSGDGLENDIYRQNFQFKLGYNKTEIDTNGRAMSLSFRGNMNHDIRDEFWAVGNVSIMVTALQPTSAPSLRPSLPPSTDPTGTPTIMPTVKPTKQPSVIPSISPSNEPSKNPSASPSVNPTKPPNNDPSLAPVIVPTQIPSISPTKFPSLIPSISPTNEPSIEPSRLPSEIPSISPTYQPSVVPSVVPTFDPVSPPTPLPTFRSKYCHNYNTNWKDWNLMQSKNDLSIYIPSGNDNGDTQFWIKMHDSSQDSSNNSNWLIGIDTIYSFDKFYFDTSDSNGNIDYFEASVDCEWSNDRANPIFAISDSQSYVVVKIDENGHIFVLGSACDGTETLKTGDILSQDIDSLSWQQLNIEENREYGFNNSQAILFGIDNNKNTNFARLIIEYTTMNDEVVSYMCTYNGTFVNSDGESLSFYMGSSDLNDNYYQLDFISFEYCSNEWDLPNSICENDNSFHFNPNNSDTVTINNKTEYVHGWFDDSDKINLKLDELLFFDEIIVNFTLYYKQVSYNVSNYDKDNEFELILSYGGNNKMKRYNHMITAPTREDCYYQNGQVRSYWYLSNDMCVFDGTLIISDIGILAHNLTIYINYNEKNDSNDYQWGFNNICLNTTDDTGNTNSPTPSPTSTVFSNNECVNKTVSAKEKSNENIVRAETEYKVSKSDSSHLSVKLIFENGQFDSTRDSMIVALSDGNKLSAVNIKPSHMEFSPSCQNISFIEFDENNSDDDFIFNLNWDPSQHYWDANDLSFENENEMTIDYYFEPLSGLTYVSLSKIYLMQQRIEFNCIWYDNYNSSQDLNIEIGSNNSSLNMKNAIEEIEIEYCSKNEKMFTTTAAEIFEAELKVAETSGACNLTCFDCLSVIDAIQVNSILTLRFGQEYDDDDDDDGTSTNMTLITQDSQDSDNEEDECDCPKGNSTLGKNVQSIDGSLVDGSSFYILVNETSETIVVIFESWDGETLNETCHLTYYVNRGTFLNVEADTTIYISFVLRTITLSNTQITQLENAFINFFMNLFGVDSSKVTVSIEAIEKDGDSDSDTTTSRRKLLEEDETSYQVDIIVIGDSNDDASSFNITQVISDLQDIAQSVIDGNVSISNVSVTVPESGSGSQGSAAISTDSDDIIDDIVDTIESLGLIGYIIVVASFVIVVSLSIGCCLCWAKYVVPKIFGKKRKEPKLFHRITNETLTKSQSSESTIGIASLSASGNASVTSIGAVSTNGMMKSQTTLDIFAMATNASTNDDGEDGDDNETTHDPFAAFFGVKSQSIRSGPSDTQLVPELLSTHRANTMDQELLKYVHAPEGDNGAKKSNSNDEPDENTIALLSVKSASKYSVPLSINDKSTAKSMVEAVTATKQALEIEYSELQLLHQIGKGQFGTVHKALWVEEEVAVKKINDDILDMQKELNEKAKKRMNKNDWHVYGSVMKNSSIDAGTFHGSTFRGISTMHSQVPSHIQTISMQTDEDSLMKPNLNDQESNFSQASQDSQQTSQTNGMSDEAKEEAIRSKLMEMRGEIILACSIPYHPNLIQVFGFVSEPLCLVMDYMAGGSVESFCYVDANRRNKRKPNFHEILLILSKAANGLKFLAEYGLVHRDIAARNILLGKLNSYGRVDHTTSVKVTDFGMTRSLELNASDESLLFGQRTKSNYGPLKWMAPESISKRLYSQQSDVYMFGITMWEIFAGKEPYPRMDAVNVAMRVVKHGFRPGITRDMPAKYAQLMDDCWSQNSLKRPLFKDVHKSLRQQLEH